MFGYLDDKGIEYTIGPAKNVSSGWVGIQCPLPGCSDSSNHCGINLQSGRYHCHVCGSSSDLIDLIKNIEGCSFSKAKKIVKGFKMDISEGSMPTTPPGRKSIRDIHFKSFNWPKDMLIRKKFPNTHKKYLRGRGFNPYEVIDKYKLVGTNRLGGRFKYSIIIPFFYNGQMVTFSSRDVTNKARSSYKHLPDRESVIPIKSLLYGLERVHKGVILVEGILDAWKIGNGACAVLGVYLTDEQLELLIEKDVRRAFILLDADAKKTAIRLEDQLKGIIDYVEVLSLDKGDPADSLTRTNIKFLKGLISE